MRVHLVLPCSLILVIAGVSIAEDPPKATDLLTKSAAALGRVAAYDFSVSLTADGMLCWTASASGMYGKPDLLYIEAEKTKDLETHRVIQGVDVSGSLSGTDINVCRKGTRTWISQGENEWKDQGLSIEDFRPAWGYLVVSRPPRALLASLASSGTRAQCVEDDSVDGVECFVVEVHDAPDELRAFKASLDSVTRVGYLTGNAAMEKLLLTSQNAAVAAIKKANEQTSAQKVDSKRSTVEIKAWIAKSDFIVHRVRSKVHLELVSEKGVENKPTDHELTYDLSHFAMDAKTAKAQWDARTGAGK